MPNAALAEHAALDRDIERVRHRLARGIAVGAAECVAASRVAAVEPVDGGDDRCEQVGVVRQPDQFGEVRRLGRVLAGQFGQLVGSTDRAAIEAPCREIVLRPLALLRLDPRDVHRRQRGSRGGRGGCRPARRRLIRLANIGRRAHVDRRRHRVLPEDVVQTCQVIGIEPGRQLVQQPLPLAGRQRLHLAAQGVDGGGVHAGHRSVGGVTRGALKRIDRRRRRWIERSVGRDLGIHRELRKNEARVWNSGRAWTADGSNHEPPAPLGPTLAPQNRSQRAISSCNAPCKNRL
ncbi:hypothetical protein [Luteimonas sp. TWI1437]|uniref:hypothetical protein n=1 Tax=unclassified Luteimonas TaxID=2629088 RepID=UPI00320B9F58